MCVCVCLGVFGWVNGEYSLETYAPEQLLQASSVRNVGKRFGCA